MRLNKCINNKGKWLKIPTLPQWLGRIHQQSGSEWAGWSERSCPHHLHQPPLTYIPSFSLLLCQKLRGNKEQGNLRKQRIWEILDESLLESLFMSWRGNKTQSENSKKGKPVKIYIESIPDFPGVKRSSCHQYLIQMILRYWISFFLFDILHMELITYNI